MVIKSYRYRIYPNKKQRKLIHKTFGCSRYIYNYYLNKRKELYQNEKKRFSYYDCVRDLTNLKQNFEWLKEPDKNALQNSLKDLNFAYERFFSGENNYPKFKSKKDNYKSYRTNGTLGRIRFENNYIRLPKLNFVKTKEKRFPQGKILNATVSQEPSGRYYCSICCGEVEVEQLPKTNQSIGIDLGLVDFAVLSDGTKIENPRFYEKSEGRIVKLQRELSRKTIGSNRYNKARIKLAKSHRHIMNQRKDFLQKLSTAIVRNYDTICIEDLNILDMKETDSSIRNKRVVDVSWAEFRGMLTYKCDWYGKKLILVDRYYPSSQICHCCGYNDGRKSEKIRVWICPKCHSELDRDVNAAINILREGLKQLNV